MQKKLTNRILAYATTVTALGASAQGAIIYKSFETTLSDPDSASINGNATTNGTLQTIGVVLFDGANITLVGTAANGGASLNAIDNYVSSGQAKTSASSIQASSNYVQTPDFVTAGQAIGEAFTQTTTTISFPAGSASNLYLGVSTPSKQYGWIRFSYTDGGKTVTIHDVAFETIPGKSINAGSQTETQGSNIGLIGLAGGLAALRRKRSRVTAQA